MRILVTGAAGFIGSHVVRRLLSDGHEVGAVIRPATSARRLEGLASRLVVVPADLSDSDALHNGLRSWPPEACIHLAWYAVPGKYLEAKENLESLEASLRLIDLLADAGCRHVVMAGTCAEYNTDLGYLQEDGPTGPATLYAAAKLALSILAAARAVQLRMTLSWARLFYLYGPYEDERRLVPALIRAVLQGQPFPASSGRQIRDYLHVEDVAAGLCGLATGGPGGTFNVCSGDPVPVRDLMSTLGRILGREDLVHLGELSDREWDPPFICGDPRRLRNATGWAPQYGLEAGLRQTVEWWKSRGS